MNTIVLVWGKGTGVGGTEARMAEAVTSWRTMGLHVVSAMTTGDLEGNLSRLMRESGSTVLPARSLASLRRMLNVEAPSLVITFGLRASLMVRQLRLLRFPRQRKFALVDARNGLEATRSPLLWTVDRASARAVDVFLANSDAVAATLSSNGLPTRKIHVLYSALGPEWSSPEPRVVRSPSSIAMVGNARIEKRQDIGLSAFAALSVPAQLTVYTNDASGIRTLWSGLRHDALGEVEFVEGHRVTPADLRRVAIVMHPSSHESAPRSLLEARASGCHIVAFDVGDTRRIVGSSGSVVGPGDEDAFRAALQRSVEESLAGSLDHLACDFPSVSQYAESLLQLVEARWASGDPKPERLGGRKRARNEGFGEQNHD